MRYLTYAVLIIINFLFQTTLFEYISIFNVKPNTMIILIVSFAFMRNDIEGALIGFFSGLLVDSFFGSFLGLNAFIGMLIGFLSGKIFTEFYKNSFFIPFLLTIICTFLNNIIFFFFNIFLRGE
ncbi:MAG: rod shape-determining protein MreD, partial [Eubacteriales bacterium]|nr:rod shape-determining protein MreD [Eubacteriales bacterium]